MRSLEEEKRKFHQLIHPWVVPSVIFASLSLLAAWFGHHQSKGLPEENVVWYSVLPPLFAIVVAISTRRLFVSFGCSILLGLTLSSFSGKTNRTLSVSDEILSYILFIIFFIFQLIQIG